MVTGVNFIDRLLELLEENNVNAYQLSKDLGVSDSLISTWKKKPSTDPSANVLHSISKYFKVDMAWLLTGEGEPTPKAPAGLTDMEEMLLEEFRAADKQKRKSILAAALSRPPAPAENSAGADSPQFVD
jgi:transcriptional regulator with XRE-family HTH domain